MAQPVAPSLSGISIASDDPLFSDMLRVAAGGQSDCSWQAPRSAAKRGAPGAGVGCAPPAAAEAAKRLRLDGAGGGAYRCLDTTHDAPCPRCTAPPGAHQADSYQLIGDPGLKNGALRRRVGVLREKKLRALLNKTAEWNNADAREAAAEACDRGGDASARALAAALRAKSCASLRKQHLFHLCATWHYASDLWRAKEGRRGDAPRAAPPPAATLAPPPVPSWPHAPPATQPPAPPPAPHAAHHALATAGAGADAAALALAGAAAGGSKPPGWDYGAFGGDALALAPDAAAEHIMAQLRPMALECAWTFEGAKAREAAARLGAEHITPRVVDALAKVTRWLHRLLLEWGQQHAAVLAWSRRCGTPEGAEEGRQLAWVALAKPGAAFSLDAALALIASLAQTSVAACAEKARVPDCTPSEAAWLQEFGAGSLMGLEVVVRLQSLLAQFKFSSLSTFLSVTSRILELGMLATSSVAANFTARDAWMRDMLAANQRAAELGSGGGGDGGGDGADSTRKLELFEFQGFPERVAPGTGGVLLLEPGDA